MYRDNLYKEEKPPFWCNVHTCLLCACLFLGPLQTSWGSRGPSLYHNTTVRILQPWMAHPKTTHQSEPHPRTTTPLFTPPNPTMVRALLALLSILEALKLMFMAEGTFQQLNPVPVSLRAFLCNAFAAYHHYLCVKFCNTIQIAATVLTLSAF